MREKKIKKRATYVTKFLAVVLLFVGTSGVIFIISKKGNISLIPVSSAVAESAPVIVIDPGHGGEDPGASSDNGILEKDVNLELSSICAVILKAGGANVGMTRSDDRMLYDLYGDLSDYEGVKKLYDLKNRIRYAEELSANLLVSVHANKFFQPQYGGLQVYYSPNDPSSTLYADSVQKTVKTILQPGNARETKKATSSIFLLKNINRPAILVECGFLSNATDIANLTDNGYKLDLASCICCAIINANDANKPTE